MITFFLDANRINARGKCSYVNQLEELAKCGKCELLMPQVSWNEAEAGDSQDRKNKTWSYYFIGLENNSSQSHWYKKIEEIVFPNGASLKNEINDVWILVTAREMNYPLVTDDGGSKSQPGGMLGNRENLKRIGVTVLRDREAVEMVLNNKNT